MNNENYKYVINARVKAKGVVERQDVTGAIFGQVGDFLDDDLDLSRLEHRGRIAPIQVDIDSEDGRTSGTISIRSNLDRARTAIIGAALETIEQIGPCKGHVKINEIRDVRAEERRTLVERASELLEDLEKTMPDSASLLERVRET